MTLQITERNCLELVARSFSLKVSDLISYKMDKETAKARQVAMYLLWMTTDYTLQQIGDALGGRTPATISHGFQRTAFRMWYDDRFREKVSSIRNQLNEHQ